MTDETTSSACVAAKGILEEALGPGLCDAGAVWFAHGASWEMVGDLSRAADAFRYAIAAAPAPAARALNALVRVSMAAGRHETDATWLAAHSEGSPVLAPLLLWSGHLLRAAARPGPAAEALRRCLERVDDPGVRLSAATELMHALADLGRLADAVDVGRAAAIAHPDREVGLRSSVAGMLHVLGRHAEALTELERVIACEPGEPGWRELHAQVAAALGDDT